MLSAIKSVSVVMVASSMLCVTHLLACHARIEITTGAWHAVLLHIGHGRKIVL